MPVNTAHHGLEYRARLAETIRRSDRIVLTEHSCPLDAYDSGRGRSRIPDEVVYGRCEFSAALRDRFLSSIDGLDPQTQNAVTACIFEPHHTLRFYAGDALLSTMAICFKCSQVKWDGADVDPPWTLYPALAEVVKSAGFSPERDWTALAEQHLARAP